jgi:hypothetical protein
MATMEKEGMFFVVNEDSTDTAPRKIYFDLEDVLMDGAEYIDVFDKDGDRIYLYMLDEENREYTRQDV